MTAPDGGSPPGALGVGLFHALQTKTVDDAKAAMSGGIVGAVTGAEEQLDDEVKTPLAGKPDVEEIPINSAIWHSMNQKEQATFPRASLVKVVNSTTGSSSGTGSHSHSVSQYATIPDYQPSGNGNDFLEIGFIRVTKDCQFSHAGFITGDSATFAGITGAYLGVFRMNASTGALTLLNTATATSNLKASITTQNTEHIFNLGVTVTASQDEVYAVGVLQDTSAFQSAASLMCTRITDISRDTGGLFPRKQYCYSGTYAAIPSSIAEASLNYSASTKLPFYYLREI
ncbi:hypothetical protein OG874_00620 [Nocardia sp. NBC_00565]|uniref:hypothetical protein n=1 Tax=Nocardia sp. NBC_00565 TaxID=2975993 RepID=UPI002E800FC7|nr:hypothetical protein [Nocardia sp. NBC_00565]WUC03759.1 hypothetical protein OG874_00620 [Nocardia sp. NBC_00565]